MILSFIQSPYLTPLRRSDSSIGIRANPTLFDLTVEWVTIIAFSGDINIEGCSTVRPPLFKGTNFGYWKNAMQIFIESTDMELWKIVNNRPYIVPRIKNDKGEEIDKPKYQYTCTNWERLTKSSRAKHILYCV